MITFNELMIAMLVIVFIVLGSVVVGGWLVFKRQAQPGEGFIVRPKGEAFTLPSAGDELFSTEPSEEEKALLDRTKTFLGRLGGNKE